MPAMLSDSDREQIRIYDRFRITEVGRLRRSNARLALAAALGWAMAAAMLGLLWWRA